MGRNRLSNATVTGTRSILSILKSWKKRGWSSQQQTSTVWNAWSSRDIRSSLQRNSTLSSGHGRHDPPLPTLALSEHAGRTSGQSRKGRSTWSNQRNSFPQQSRRLKMPPLTRRSLWPFQVALTARSVQHLPPGRSGTDWFRSISIPVLCEEERPKGSRQSLGISGSRLSMQVTNSLPHSPGSPIPRRNVKRLVNVSSGSLKGKQKNQARPAFC